MDCPICGSSNTQDSKYNDGYRECKDCGADWRVRKPKGL